MRANRQLDGASEFATKLCKPAIIRAFTAAKTASGDTDGSAGDFVTRGEFRILLVYLKRYFEARVERVECCQHTR